MNRYWLAGVLFLILFSYACEEDATEKAPKLMVYLTDGPADLEAVNIEIIDVQINPQGDANGWRSLGMVHPGTYDLLMLTGGIDTLLGEADIPEGRLDQIRLILGDGNSVKVNGQIQTLKTPSAQQSGLKIQIKQDLQPGITYKLLLDFDAGRSIVKAGNSGKFLLKPVLRASLEAQTGSIRGQISPADVLTLVTAFNAVDTISALTSETGMFLLRGVPAGTYQLLISPEENSGFLEKTINGVNVQINQSTDVGTIVLMN